MTRCSWLAIGLALAAPAADAAIRDYVIQTASQSGNTGDTRSGPSSGLTSWQTTAWNGTAGSGVWGVQARAICANVEDPELVITTPDGGALELSAVAVLGLSSRSRRRRV
jgi:hypothetical protein